MPFTPEQEAKIAYNRRTFAEAQAATPWPTEPTKDDLIAALIAEGMESCRVSGESMHTRDACKVMPEEDVRSLLYDLRTLATLERLYPERAS